MTAPRKPILTDEEIIAEAETYTVYKPCEDNFRQGFRLGARFALAASEKREELWRELTRLALSKSWSDCDEKRFDELCEMLSVDGSSMYAVDNGN